MDVFQATRRLAGHEKIEQPETDLLLTAALFHDAGFLFGVDDHETLSCGVARDTLKQFEYNDDAIDKICELILATKLPQKPKGILEEIICDADLDYLGRDDFFDISERLCEEMLELRSISSKEDFNKLQIRFLEEHRYFTASAQQEREEKKQQHLASIKAIAEH